MENYYDILGVPPTASKEEIERSILKQQRLWHSRVNSPDFERRVKAERMLKQLEEMRTILLDEQKRQLYDKSYYPIIHSEPSQKNKRHRNKGSTVPQKIKRSRKNNEQKKGSLNIKKILRII